MTFDGKNHYLYNADGQVCAVQWTYNSLTVMTGYIYDGDGNRVAKGTISTWGSCDPSVNGFTTQSDYVRDQAGNQLTELDADSNGNITGQHTNVWANGQLIGTCDRNGVHFYLNDWVGTRRVQTDYAGVVEQNCQSLPFGDSETCSPLPTENLFTGKERDDESGNDYFEARYYASTMGRFLSPDWSDKPEPVPYSLLDNPQSLNLYSYVKNNPLSKSDPDGHCDVDGEHHGGLWCFAHALGITETAKEQAADAQAERQLIASKGLTLPNGHPLDADVLSRVSDKDIWSLARNLAGAQSDQQFDQAINAAASIMGLLGGGGKDITRSGSRFTNTDTGMTQDEFGKQLESQGFSKGQTSDGSVQYSKPGPNGGSTEVTMYNQRTSTGVPGGQVKVDGVITEKLSFKP